MEFLIPGLILVALMAWLSTRIKRNAAAAYEAETIETDEFVINKPEGFLHVLNDDSSLAFHAYSKDFGSVVGKDERKATIEIDMHRGKDIDEVRREIGEVSESVSNERSYVDGGEKALEFESKMILNGGEYDVLSKLITRGLDVFDVRASILSDHKDEYFSKMEEMLLGIRIK